VYTVVVTVAAPFTPTLRQIDNVASAGDDGLGGFDPSPSNNSATDSDAVDAEVVTPAVPIPTTGAEVTRLVVPAVLLIGGGIVLLVGARRPRSSRRRGNARRSLI
jgi:hypothetical protein